MDYEIGSIDIGDLPDYNLPEPTISLVNYDAETGIVEFSDGSTYNTNTAEYIAGEGSYTDPSYVSNQVYATRFGERAPQIVEYFDRWQNLLSSGAEIPQDIDKRDDAFNETIYFTDPDYQGFQDPSPITWAAQNLKSFEDIRTLADLPDYLSIYDDYKNSEDIITSETVSDAYWTLLSGDGPEAALSEYYGTDVNLGDTTGADYSNISKYGDIGEEEFRQFQSIIKPILETSVPYVMLTQGLDYTDAVEYTYTHDPMAAAVYTAYGVDLYRQTSDGSTYIFDPILGQEMRSLEVKDPNLRDIMPTIAQIIVITTATYGLGNLFSSMYANAGLSGTSIGASSGSADIGATLAEISASQGATSGSALQNIIATATGGTAGAGSAAVQAGSAASIAGQATAAALITLAQTGDVEQALKSAVLAGGTDFLANSNIVRSTLDSFAQYVGIDGIELNLSIGDAASVPAGTLASSAAASLGSLFDILTSGGFGGAGAGALCFAPPCEPGTIFVGNALNAVGNVADEVISSGVIGGPLAGAGATGITAAQFWNEFRNQWYNYKPDENNVDDPNANLPGFDILPEDSTALKLAKSLANSFGDTLAPQVMYNKNTGEWEESYQFSDWLQENVQKFADNIDDDVTDAAKEFLKKAVDNAEETGDRTRLMWSTIAINTGGEMLKWLNTTFTSMEKYDPDTPLAKFAGELQGLAEAAQPEDFKARVREMDAAYANAESISDAAAALYGSFEETPADFFYHYLAGEVAEEAAQFGISAIAGGTAGALSYFKNRGEDFAKAVAKKASKQAAVGADMLTGWIEGYGGEAAGAYEEAKALALKQGMGEEEAEEYAQTLANQVGMTSAISEMAASALGLDAITNFIAGKRGEGSAFIQAAITTAIEGATEAVQGGIVSLVKNWGLSDIDPTIDVNLEVGKDALLEGLLGTFIGGGVGSAQAFSDALRVNVKVQEEIGRATINNPDDPAAAAEEVKETFNNPDSFYNQAMQGFREDFGVDFTNVVNTVTSSDILNTVYDPGYTSTEEVKDAFNALGYEGFTPTYEDMLNILNGAYDNSTVQSAVLDYAEPLYTSRGDILAAAEDAGVTLTEEQISGLIGRNDGTDVGTKIAELLPDPNNLSSQTVHIDYDTSTYYFSDGSTFNSDTGVFSSGSIDADGNITYADGSVYSPDTGDITNASGVSTTATTQISSTGNNDGTGTTWFDEASDADKGVANTLWGLYQNAINSNDQNTADQFLTMYRNLTGVDIQPPDYEPPDDGGGGTGQNPDSGQNPTGGVDLTNLLNQLIQNGATTEQIDNLRTEIIGLMGNVASQESVDAVQDTVDEILTSLTDVAKQSTLVAFRDQLFNMISGLASQSSVDSLAARVAANEAAGMTRDEATQKAIQDLSAQLGVGVDELAAAINENRDAIGDIGISIDELNTAVTSIQDQLKNVASQTSVNEIRTLMEQYQAQNMSQFEALQQAIADISAQTGKTPESILAEIAANRDAINALGVDIGTLNEAVISIQNQLKDVATRDQVENLSALVTQYEAAGLSRDAALQQAIKDLSEQTGQSVVEIQAALAANQDTLDEFGLNLNELNTAVTNIQEQLKNVATKDQVENLSNLVAQYEADGLSRDEALQQAIKDLSEQTGQSVEEIQAALATNQDTLNEFGLNLNELNTAVGSIQEQLKNVASQSSVDRLLELINEYEAAGQNRDTATQNAISDLSTQLGTTEQNLINEILGSEQRITGEINTIADLIGKPPSAVTDADIDFVSDIIAQQEALGELFEYTQQQLAYDVTGDGVIDATDLDILQRALQGEDVDISLASQFQPTGLYGYNQQLAQQTQGTVIDQATQTRDLVTSEAERTRLEGIAGDLLGILEPSDITGRKVTVDTPDPARIGYLYDFSSIFATPQQEGMFVSPYGGQRGYAKGGTVLDINDELLKLLER